MVDAVRGVAAAELVTDRDMMVRAVVAVGEDLGLARAAHRDEAHVTAVVRVARVIIAEGSARRVAEDDRVARGRVHGRCARSMLLVLDGRERLLEIRHPRQHRDIETAGAERLARELGAEADAVIPVPGGIGDRVACVVRAEREVLRRAGLRGAARVLRRVRRGAADKCGQGESERESRDAHILLHSPFVPHIFDDIPRKMTRADERETLSPGSDSWITRTSRAARTTFPG